MKTNIVYTLSKPTNQTREKHPAIFIMHGMGSNENDLPSIVQQLKNDYYIFSLRGPISQPPGYSFFTIERIGVPHQEPFEHILKELQNFIEEAKSNFEIDEKGIYLLGFSQGAILSQSLAQVMGNKISWYRFFKWVSPRNSEDDGTFTNERITSLHCSRRTGSSDTF